MVVLASLDEVIKKFLLDKNYEVREDGTIWTTLHKNGKGYGELRRIDRLDNRGYYHIVRYYDRYLLCHRIIYARYVGELKEELQINHKNGVKTDNRPENLELVTSGENQEHKYRVLKSPAIKGNKKIDQQIAEQIRKESANGIPYSELARKFNLSKSSIRYIVKAKTWK